MFPAEAGDLPDSVKKICKNLICCHVQVSIRIRKSASVPSEIITSSDIVTTGSMVIIFGISGISGHIFLSQCDRLAGIASTWCRGT